jgi:hypothetical protein
MKENETQDMPQLDMTAQENTEQTAQTAADQTAKQTTGKKSRIDSFTGEYLNPVKRRVTRPDPSNPQKMIVTNKVLEGPVGLVLQYVVGKGFFDNTKEPFIATLGQYAPGKTCRVTFSSQHARAFADLIRGNLDVSSGYGPNQEIKWPLKKEIVVDVFGTKMRGYALLAEELYVHNDDGTIRAVIGAAQSKTEHAELEEMVL